MRVAFTPDERGIWEGELKLAAPGKAAGKETSVGQQRMANPVSRLPIPSIKRRYIYFSDVIVILII